MNRFVAVGAVACGLCSAVTFGQDVVVTASQKASTGEHKLTPRELLEIVDIGGYTGAIEISPDGKWVAFQLQRANLETNNYDITWHLLSLDSGAVKRVGAGGEIVLAGSGSGRVNGAREDVAVKWSPDSQWIAYLRKDRNETHLWRSSLWGEQLQVTHGEADVRGFEWSEDGHELFFTVGAGREALRQRDRREGDVGYLFDDRFFVDYAQKPLEFPCGEELLPGEAQVDVCTRKTMWAVNVPDGRVREVTGKESQAHAGMLRNVRATSEKENARVSVKASPDGARSAWFANEDAKIYGGFQPPMKLFVSDAGVSCSVAACHGQGMENLWWSRDSREIFFQRREGVASSQSAIYAWKLADNHVRKVLLTEDKIFSCGSAGQRLICLREGWTRPREIVSISLTSGKVNSLFDPNPNFKAIARPTVEKLQLEDGFGNRAVAHLMYPIGYRKGTRYPAVIVQYRSRGFLRGGVGDEYPIPIFAANGFVVVSFDRPEDRELSARIGDPLELERRLWADFYDKKSALNALDRILDSLDSRGIIHPSHIGITGLSDGEETVNYALIHSRRFAAAAVSSSYWNPSVFYLAPVFWRRQIESQFGDPHESLERWRGISLSLNAKEINTPLLIQVANTELLPAMENYSSLKAAGKPVEMYVYPDAYHIKWLPSQRYATYRRSLQWMQFWLQGVEAADPLDPDQYQRWRRLREGVSSSPSPTSAAGKG